MLFIKQSTDRMIFVLALIAKRESDYKHMEEELSRLAKLDDEESVADRTLLNVNMRVVRLTIEYLRSEVKLLEACGKKAWADRYALEAKVNERS